jgi:hypothetical protein
LVSERLTPHREGFECSNLRRLVNPSFASILSRRPTLRPELAQF